MVDSNRAPASLVEAFGLEGQHALVTGGSSGIGLATARCFIAAGARVTILGTDPDKLQRACETLGDSAGAVAFDVGAADEAEALAGRIERDHGAVSILVNNAGSNRRRPVEETGPEDMRAMLDVHVTGAYALARAFLPQIERRSGSILFTASMASFLGIAGMIGYSAAKAAHIGLVRALSAELAPRGVRVNGVAPGWIETPLLQEGLAADQSRHAKILSRVPLGRLGEPEDIGWAMTYLASPAARYVSGHILVVDGGALHAF